MCYWAQCLGGTQEKDGGWECNVNIHNSPLTITLIIFYKFIQNSAHITVQKYYHSQANIPTCFGASHHYHQGRQFHRPRTPLLLGCLYCHAQAVYLVAPSTQRLLMSHFPHIDQWGQLYCQVQESWWVVHTTAITDRVDLLGEGTTFAGTAVCTT